MSLVKEFRDFAMRGNVIDLAVGVIIGAAFGLVVKSLVDDVLMPPLGYLTGNLDFSDKVKLLKPATATEKAITLNYGKFISACITFTIQASAIFFVVKIMNNVTRQFNLSKEVASAAKAPDVVLLEEIRDLLAKSRPNDPLHRV